MNSPETGEVVEAAAKRNRDALWLVTRIAGFAITILLGAFLLFQVEPLIGKFILPWYGGTTSVWTTCMLFFQIMLFAGYAYAHLLHRYLSPRTQAIVHSALICLVCLTLPVIPSNTWKPLGDEAPIPSIVRLLLMTVGAPFFVLSATGPLLQGWFSRTLPGRSPYWLYALSNFGSLAALITYPFLFERIYSSPTQAVMWSWGFGVFVVCCCVCAFWLARAGGTPTTSPIESASHTAPVRRPSAWKMTFWFSLAMVPSLMLLATTNQVCLDTASMPFLWIVPLTLYLLSFILSFSFDVWYWRLFYMCGMVLSCLTFVPVFRVGPNLSLIAQISGYFSALFFVCMVCHGELVRLKPNVQHLTTFYLLMSAGGAAGGIFVALIAPLIFNNYFELHIGLFAAVTLLLIALFTEEGGWLQRGRPRILWALMLLAWGGFAFALESFAREFEPFPVTTERNFYGVLRLVQLDDPVTHQLGVRVLRNGRIIHGIEFMEPARRRTPTAYYSEGSGVGRVLSDPGQNPRHVGVVGLGVGTLATYAQRGDKFEFYEINPRVVQIARESFYFLSECRGDADIHLGDARLTLERQPPQNFDVFVLDAFSGDAIPIHLLTAEAFSIYLSHLKPDGIIAVHISNRYFTLAPVINAMADKYHLSTAFQYTPENGTDLVQQSFWMLVARTPQLLKAKNLTVRDRKSRDPSSWPDAEPMEPPGNNLRVLWTDDHASLFDVWW